jgi:hypothetical protein
MNQTGKYALLSLVFLLFSEELFSQRFGGGIKAGGNFSQIDGDDVAGFNRLGICGGVYGTARIKSYLDFKIEFMYSQRGSKSTPKQYPVNIALRYLEVPLILSLKDWKSKDEENSYYRMKFDGGLSLGRLFSADAFNNIDEDFKTNDISWLAGVEYFYHKNFGMGLRYTRSLTPVYRYSINNVERKMISYYLSLTLNYQFN